jgi:pimeloyl-ACP methyl ester carboxylesterase
LIISSALTADIDPEMMPASPFGEAYARLAPNPDDWPRLLNKIGDWGRNFKDLSPEAIQSVRAPALLAFGDSDVIFPEHAVEVFRLLGGGMDCRAPGSPFFREPRTSRSYTAPNGWSRW